MNLGQSSDRPFAVFDIDGTLIRWQLYHALADELARQGHLETSQFQKVRQARMNWKRRTNTFTAYEQTLVELINSAIVGISEGDLKNACQAVLNEYKDQVYTYTRDLIKDLKTKCYLIFAISASPQEIVELLADYYGFDDFGGSFYETKDGLYTGKADILMSSRKTDFLNVLINKHNVVKSGSLAVGDSESDIAMLAGVDNPIAFNPTKELFDHAQKSGWPIIVERKNMVYQLTPKNGKYFLA
ncbi:MAG TPA: HAD family phosphatase [Candidatus Saccharimonadales bacterium]|nr:HAD family phosphatase [Candidatus Saccharimonadales bacterium]